ncbi:hypothetical protein [Leucobacter salsicius]|uniref:hypothetical protein n=1 Tax=Leucobacter salsicius TaxID=664638 RepID=UPI00037DB197|nr:hypothetical protein [Leucobacter salsicius]
MKDVWLSFKEWVAGLTLYMAIAPWVLPVVGGILISSNLKGAWWFGGPFIVGVVLIALGSIPLGIRDSWIDGEQKEADARKAKELQTRSLLSDELESIVLPAELQNDQVEEHVRAILQRVLDALVSEAYSDVTDVRAVFFRPGMLDSMPCVFPAISTGKPTGRPARIHLTLSPRYEGISKLFEDESETHFENGILGRSYTGFASAAVSYESTALGVLTLDAPGGYVFDQQDAQNLLAIARFFTAMLNAESQNLGTPLGSGSTAFEQYVDSLDVDKGGQDGGN